MPALPSALPGVLRAILRDWLEASEPGWGASGRNGGEVLPGLKLLPEEIIARLGAEAGERLSAFAEAGPDLVFELIDRYKIQCEATRAGWLIPAHSKDAEKGLRDNLRQLKARGYDADWLEPAAASAQLGTKTWHSAIIDRRGGTVQPFGYARGLCRAARQDADPESLYA